jgi:hypothetical protein
MEDMGDQLILEAITHNRRALVVLRKTLQITKTDIEVLAFAHRVGLFSTFQLRTFYLHTNIQQLRASLQGLVKAGNIDLINAAVKNKPAHYMITYKGTLLMAKYIQIIRNRN